MTKKSVHRAGALSFLLEKGMVSSVDNPSTEFSSEVEEGHANSSKILYKTNTGILFSENEIVSIPADECQAWEYANREQSDLGDLEGLKASIKVTGQLQPALIRPTTKPNGNVKYDVIFGYRRLLSCKELGIPLLAILKNDLSIHDALLMQENENENREGVSNYSKALHYKRLLNDGIFSSEKELVEKFKIPKSSLNDLLAFTRIPEQIIKSIPKIHELSIGMALKIENILRTIPGSNSILITLAHDIGANISSPVKLEQSVKSALNSDKVLHKKSVLSFNHSDTGKKLFTLRMNSQGTYNIAFSKDVKDKLDYERICSIVKEYIEKELS